MNVCSGVVPENPWEGSRIFETRDAAVEYIQSNSSPDGCTVGLYKSELNLETAEEKVSETQENAQ